MWRGYSVRADEEGTRERLKGHELFDPKSPNTTAGRQKPPATAYARVFARHRGPKQPSPRAFAGDLGLSRPRSHSS
jgi:hypothetical protein